MKTVFTHFFTLLIFCSCVQLTGGKTGANDTHFLEKIGGLFFQHLGGQKSLLEGVIKNGGDSANNFNLKLNLPHNQMAKFYFFSSKTLVGGIILELKRQNDDVLMTLTINGTGHLHTIDEFPNNSTIDLSIDIHGDHEDVHILIWNGSGPFNDSDTCVSDNSCLYNTESFTPPYPGPWGNQGKTLNSYWGHEGNREYIVELQGPQEPISKHGD